MLGVKIKSKYDLQVKSNRFSREVVSHSPWVLHPTVVEFTSFSGTGSLSSREF